MIFLFAENNYPGYKKIPSTSKFLKKGERRVKTKNKIYFDYISHGSGFQSAEHDFK